MKKPIPKDYGYIESNSFEEESGWMIEGGEEKYYDDLASYELTIKLHDLIRQVQSGKIDRLSAIEQIKEYLNT